MSNLSGQPRGNLSGPGTGAESETTQLVARARLMMIVASLTTALAIAAVVAVIGYRIYAAGVPASEESVIVLPKGARVIATSGSAGRIAVTVDVNGAIEVLTFDIKTMKQTGRLRFATEP